MEANQLRIGNHISRLDLGDNSVRIEKILELKKEKVLTSGPVDVLCTYTEIKPVLLTKEWVKIFGYGDYGINDKNIFLIYVDENYLYYQENPSIEFGFYLADYESNILSEKIKFVHEFQNIIFALTKKEVVCKII